MVLCPSFHFSIWFCITKSTVLLRPFFWGQANTLSLNVGANSITFENVVGPSGLVVSGEGSNNLISGSGTSSVYSTTAGGVQSVRTEIPFGVGSLSYFNGSTQIGSNAESATLQFDLGTTIGTLNFNLDFLVTTNTSDVRDSADIIEVSMPISSNVFNISGIPHVGRLSLSNPSTGGFTNVSMRRI